MMACHIFMQPLPRCGLYSQSLLSSCAVSLVRRWRQPPSASVLDMILVPRNSTPGEVDIESRHEVLLIVGPVLIGALINWLLLGALTMQLYVYYLCFPRDSWLIKFTAYGLYLLELGQTVFVAEMAWADMCEGWGIPSALSHIGWGFSMNPIVCGLIACCVQIFFAWRVWALGHNPFWKSIAVFILIVSFAQGCAAVTLGVKLSTVWYLYDRAEALAEDLLFYYLGGSAVADFLIASSMLYFLISSRRRPAWSKETDRRITKLIRSTFDTGVLFSAMAFLDLAAYLHMSYLHVSISMVLSKLYSNSLMASLNSRARVSERFTSESRRESCETSRRCDSAQFTSVGIPVTIGDIEWSDGREGQSVKSGQEYGKTGRPHASIPLSNLGRENAVLQQSTRF
ncbi:hypothetical protein BJV77DRAFT_718173 [Russula vinacea]|nr:hypothetical protein BJV77DRAFT_718173 [Russula vinacea]